MKTVLLFSSVFYLLGLAAGNTIEVVKRIIHPVRSVISAPAPKPESGESDYHYAPKEPSIKKETVKSDSTRVADKPKQ
jgi:hypothetical protein